jgi:hypothetical protein
LAAGLALWVGYGVLKDDIVIMMAVGLTLVATLIAFKIRTPGRHAKLLLPLQHLLLEIVDKVLCTFLREHLARLVRDVSFFT